MTTTNSPVITKISGPLVTAAPMKNAQMYEVVWVSNQRLIGEIIELRGDTASIQVYEETGGIRPGEPVEQSGATLSVELGPGLLTSIYDGIQRPLPEVAKVSDGPFIARGVEVKALSRTKKWEFTPTVERGQRVKSGDILGTVQETDLVVHHIMVPPRLPGEDEASSEYTVEHIERGSFVVTDTVATLKREDGTTRDVSMVQRWPIRNPRPVAEQLIPSQPLTTGIRILDTLFPIAKGGSGAIPGPFGAGKTVTNQSVAKHCDAQVIIYIGCGERGNEMTEILEEFPHLKDPKTGRPLMERTVLIANTSNMPVAAREASVYTGITIAEYYRDMGYDVALMADSTSRWAEAMREISGRLEEMPGEEGYPAYLGSRTASFYERAGAVQAIGKDQRKGSLTVIGAVSPPGGDFSEPVTQNTLRVTKVFWALDAKLAHRRHFPAINWLDSYSLYEDNLSPYITAHVADDFAEYRSRAQSILQEEARLEEIVRLVGAEALSPREQIALFVAKIIREDFLFQNLMSDEEARTALQKQYRMLRVILKFADALAPYSEAGEEFRIDNVQKLPVREAIARMGHIPENDLQQFDVLERDIEQQTAKLAADVESYKDTSDIEDTSTTMPVKEEE